jgi:predicted RNase H-like HicB family nuclease
MISCGEFEFVESDGQVAALPCWKGGATEGATLDEAVSMAADWLRMAALDAVARGEALDCGGFGHAPKMGGRVIAVAVEVDRSDVPSMSAADAARALGVSTARVAQLCCDGKLDSWREGSCRMVSCESVEDRLADRVAG